MGTKKPKKQYLKKIGKLKNSRNNFLILIIIQMKIKNLIVKKVKLLKNKMLESKVKIINKINSSISSSKEPQKNI